MSNIVLSSQIIDIFNKLNKSQIDYILIRNISKELPNNLKIGKDIDILVKYEQIDDLRLFFEKNGFKKIPHPHRGNIFLYGVKKFQFYKDGSSVLFDLNFHLVCRSLDAGQWIPLDQTVQGSAWKSKRFETKNDFSYWALSYEDEFIALIVRSIFDKREFQKGYTERILELLKLVDIDDVKTKMNLIFFKYTDTLLKQVQNKQFNNIISNYISFREY